MNAPERLRWRERLEFRQHVWPNGTTARGAERRLNFEIEPGGWLINEAAGLLRGQHGVSGRAERSGGDAERRTRPSLRACAAFSPPSRGHAETAPARRAFVPVGPAV